MENAGSDNDGWSLSSASVDCAIGGGPKDGTNPGSAMNHPDVDPLDILTGEGRSGGAGWLCSGGESNLVASGMERVGGLDPGEVRINQALFCF